MALVTWKLSLVMQHRLNLIPEPQWQGAFLLGGIMEITSAPSAQHWYRSRSLVVNEVRLHRWKSRTAAAYGRLS